VIISDLQFIYHFDLFAEDVTI